MTQIKYTPKEIFKQILEWAVIPTFDLVIEYGNNGVIIVKRTIAPYQNQWVLPGLRMFKTETINASLERIAKQEVNLKINPNQKFLLGRYVGRFKTEHNRQDLSTGYSIKIDTTQSIKINPDHFSEFKLIHKHDQIPANMGAMYRYYLREHFQRP